MSFARHWIRPFLLSVFMGFSAWHVDGHAADEFSDCAPLLPQDQGDAQIQDVRGRLEDRSMEGAARARLLDRLATLHEERGEFGAAEQALLDALTIHDAPPSNGSAAVATLERLGLMQRAQGNLQAAIRTLLRCVRDADGDFGPTSLPAAACRTRLGVTYRDLGMYFEAKEALDRAVAIRTMMLQADDPDLEFVYSVNGTLHLLLGDIEKAQSYYTRSLNIASLASMRCRPAHAASLHLLADARDVQGDHAQALELRRRSLALRLAILPPGDHSVAAGWMGLAETLSHVGNHAEALKAASRAYDLHLKILGRAHIRTLQSLLARARALRALERFGDSREALLTGLTYASEDTSPEILWRFQDALRAEVERQGQKAAAIHFGQAAVRTIERLRGRVTRIDPGLQRLFVTEEKSRAYRALANLLIDDRRYWQAQEVLDLLKVQEYDEYTRGAGRGEVIQARETPLDVPDVSWRARYAEIQDSLARIATDLHALDQKYAQLGESDRARHAQLDADRIVAEKKFEQVIGQLRAVRVDRAVVVEQNNPRLQEVLRETAGGAVVLHYVVAPDRVRILVSLPALTIARESEPITDVQFFHKVAAFRAALRSQTGDVEGLAQDLYRTLISPVAKDLEYAKAQTLVLSLDGEMRYIPMAALHDGRKYLVEKYAIALYTPAAPNNLAKAPVAGWRVAAMGVTKPHGPFGALPAVESELRGIVRQGNRGILPGDVYLNEEFDNARLRSVVEGVLEKRYQVIHIASHFVFRAGTERSSLLLGDGKEVPLSQLRHIRWPGVELMTLSACETAVGEGRNSYGVEIESFGVFAQKQGAQAVIATLWKVADSSTARLMQDLYRLRAGGNLDKAKALQQAQLALLHGRAPDHGAATAGPRANGPYGHPYYWAPFVLMGNWL